MFILDKKKNRGKYILIQLHVTVNNVINRLQLH